MRCRLMSKYVQPRPSTSLPIPLRLLGRGCRGQPAHSWHVLMKRRDRLQLWMWPSFLNPAFGKRRDARGAEVSFSATSAPLRFQNDPGRAFHAHHDHTAPQCIPYHIPFRMSALRLMTKSNSYPELAASSPRSGKWQRCSWTTASIAKTPSRKSRGRARMGAPRRWSMRR